MSNKTKQRKQHRYKDVSFKQANALQGGLADDLSIEDLAKMHKVSVDYMKRQVEMGRKVELEHTDNDEIAVEIAFDHLYEIPDYYDRLKKMETEADKEDKTAVADVDEMTGADASGAFVAPMGEPIKREIHKMNNMKDYLSEDSIGSSGEYDAPAFENSKKDPLKIAGPKVIEKRAREINKNKKFPKFGGPDGVFVKVKEKCKTFPYCNEGPGAIELVREDKEIRQAILEISNKRGIPYDYLENLVINEIKSIFI